MSNAVKYPTMATVKDAAAKFGISEYFLRNLCRAGRFALSVLATAG